MRSSSNRHSAKPRPSVRKLLESLILGENKSADPKRGRLLLESLEQRQLLAGDMDLLFTDGNPQPETAAETGGLQVAGQAEGELAPDLVQFAKDLADAGVEFFGAEWCPALYPAERAIRGWQGRSALSSRSPIPIDHSIQSASPKGSSSFRPGSSLTVATRLSAFQTLETLSERSGVAIPQSEQPTFEPVGNVTVQIGSPLHIPIDAYDPDFDPDGGPLTVTVTVDNPSLLEATVLTGNRSIRIDMATYGDMVFELFEQRAPVASGRVADLAEAGFYDGIIFHRVVDDFVIQAGDPTGTGTSGSTLGQFDDDFNAELQHNREGVLSFAKSSDDTNNSQFFVTEVPTRFLDFNHSIFGQLVEGFDVREAISETKTTSSRPDIDVTIETIEVFDDNENSVIMLKALGTTGTTSVTIRLTDQDGNTYSETIQVAVVNDTANSQPFLNTIPIPATLSSDTPATLQLSSVDVEGDAVTYFGQSLSAASSGTVAVNSTTGLVTVTPASGFTGTINVQVGVEPGPGVLGNASSDMDTQTVPFTFESESVLAPTSVDLQTGSDSGTSNIDNLTNDGSLSFQVTGVTSGATVELVLANGTVVGTGVATGSSVVITTNNIAALGDGSYVIAARQTIGNDTSLFSPTVTIDYDSTAPDSVVSSASTQGNVGRVYQTDLISSEEGSGLLYSFLSAPTNASINATTGVIDWTPVESQVGANTFTIELVDAAGNVRSESFSVDVADAPLAEIKLELTDLQGTPITSVAVGQTFLLNFIGVDARSPFSRDGVFGAFADVLFDSSLVRPVPGSVIQYDDRFPAVQKGTFSNGLIDELGAVTDRLSATNLAESLIATIRMEALASGTVNIRSEPADDVDSEVLLYGIDDEIEANAIAFGSVTLAIGQSFTVGDDAFTVAEDSGATTLDVLANDVVVSGGGTLAVVSVTQPSSGGTVSLSGGIVSFTPAPDFNGQAAFTYRVSGSGGVQENGSVTVTVSAVNDPPDGVSDTFNVDQNSSANTLDVLANDRIAPDVNQTLLITDLGGITGGTTTNGGTVSIAGDGQSLIYTPAVGFTGTDTFTYVVSDGGLTDVVDVNVTVAIADNPPTAVDNSFTVTEDDSEAEFDVLTDDLRDIDNQAFVISSVGIPSQGGSVRISTDGTQFFYAPAANFAGTEQVTYTIRDTGGGLSVATVTFTVTAVNDAPPILNPTVGLSRGAGQTLAFELDDLPENVDEDETLTITNVAATTTAGGTAEIDGQSILYTPPSTDFTGSDTITFTIDDGNGETSTGTITINVADFAERDIVFNLPSISSFSQVNGITLEGTNLLGETVAIPLTYGGDRALFDSILPGSYKIRIPAIPFLQNGSEPREIDVTSAAEDGDMTVESGLGRLRPEFISIRDWLGSTSRNSILVAVAPGETSILAMQSSGSDTISGPTAKLDADGGIVTIEGTVPDSTDLVQPTTIATTSDSRLQRRGEIDGIQLFRISNVVFSSAGTATTGGEAELVIPESSSLADPPVGLTAAEVSSTTLALGDVQAEGESIVASATTQADIFVPVTGDDSSRTDATVLALEEGDLWLGQSLQGDDDAVGVVNANSIDSAMQSVTSELTSVSPAGDEIAENSGVSASLDQSAIDAVLSSDL